MPTLNSSPTRKPRHGPAPALASWAQIALATPSSWPTGKVVCLGRSRSKRAQIPTLAYVICAKVGDLIAAGPFQAPRLPVLMSAWRSGPT